MLMGTDRVFYLGLLGAPSLRNFGSLTVYASLQRPLRIALPGGDWVERDMAVVPPFQPHRIATDDQMIGAIMIEPESIDFGRLPAALQPTDGGPDAAMLERIRAAYAYLQRIGMSASVEGLDGDQLFWGEALPRRHLDPRVEMIVERIAQAPNAQYTAEECAAAAGLSFSRFLHVFKDDVGATFRKFRAWKRARSMLYHVTRRTTLLDVALEVGYPDSTHFSHSIRQVYGLPPREIFAGSRRLSLLVQERSRVRAA
ncbi:helix-turn-helix transcriptional regulator [Ectothiorhodospiraceae bacterium WFHF3C12]|nr:helix-turn-helix transcriptional regulator [Ectothiorhodospiraceae bacterium WFHF3C12]